jgi:hypothetical protein
LESHNHFIGCIATSQIKWQTYLITVLGKQLDKTKTDTNLKDAIINAPDCAMADRTASISGPFKSTLCTQEHIGWHCMLQGYWASEWQIAFNNMYMMPDKETSEAKSK